MTPASEPRPDQDVNGLPTAVRQNMRAARRNRGLTQQDVADKVGITVRSVSGWECGKAIPHLGTLAALARALGQEPERFVGPAQERAARRRAERVAQAAERIEGALIEVVRRIRVGS